MASNIRLVITTGDTDGIGWEITNKALNAIGPKAGVQFIFFKSPSGQKPPFTKKFKHKLVTTLQDAAAQPFDDRTAIEVRSSLSPAHWVEEAARLCFKGRFNGLVTAPLSKTSIIDSGLNDIGHTEILSRVTGCKHLFMGFIGQRFNVVLATGHKPLRDAIDLFSLDVLARATDAANELRSVLPKRRMALPIAIVGLNPHAGEDGLIGDDENFIKSWIEGRQLGPSVDGPLVPDSAFLPQNWKRYSVYVCPYHDQGLIPFKMVHGFRSGVHLTLGLPFVRTSVDHGTAKELFGKNKAEFGSMKDALTTAIRLCKEKRQ